MVFLSCIHAAKPSEAMAPSGVKSKLVIFCALVVLQTAAAAMGNQSAARRLLQIWKCQYRNCNCRTCPIYGWACCS